MQANYTKRILYAQNGYFKQKRQNGYFMDKTDIKIELFFAKVGQ